MRVIETAHRRDDPPVAEPDHDLGANGDATRDPLDNPDDGRRLAARGHEVDDTNPPLARLPLRLEHQRSVSIPALRLALLRRRDDPATVLAVTQQRCESGVGVETRDTAPVDRALAVDERRRLQVGQERVILDPSPHGLISAPAMYSARRWMLGFALLILLLLISFSLKGGSGAFTLLRDVSFA
jgi:hypothetical protein